MLNSSEERAINKQYIDILLNTVLHDKGHLSAAFKS